MKEDIKISKADMAKLHNDGEVEIDGEKVSFQERLDLFMEKNVPTDTSKWAYYVAKAKEKYDVYPSAYANAFAVKQYNDAGGGWKKEKKENKGLWHNIRAKKARGEKSSPKNSKAYKSAKAAGEKLNRMKEYEYECYDESCGYTLSLQRIEEGEYQGRDVKLNKPMAGDVKKFKVYVKNDKGNVVKVNFGQKGMKIKKGNPERRKSFRARHNCDNPGPRTKARYWSCRKW